MKRIFIFCACLASAFALGCSKAEDAKPSAKAVSLIISPSLGSTTKVSSALGEDGHFVHSFEAGDEIEATNQTSGARANLIAGEDGIFRGELQLADQDQIALNYSSELGSSAQLGDVVSLADESFTYTDSGTGKIEQSVVFEHDKTYFKMILPCPKDFDTQLDAALTLELSYSDSRYSTPTESFSFTPDAAIFSAWKNAAAEERTDAEISLATEPQESKYIKIVLNQGGKAMHTISATEARSFAVGSVHEIKLNGEGDIFVTVFEDLINDEEEGSLDSEILDYEKGNGEDGEDIDVRP